METNLFQTSGVSPGFRRKALPASTALFKNKLQIESTFLNARLREPIPFRQDKLPWHEWILTLRAGKKTQPIRNLAQPLPLPALSYEQHAYVNDRNENAVQILPTTDAPLSGFLELARWRHDFPPPQNVVAEQLAAASAHQAVSKEKESLVWFPDSKKWESLGTHDCDGLLFEFLLNHDDRRAGPWQHAKAQLTLSNLFHVRHPMAAPKPISSAHDIPTSISSRDLSNLRDNIPTYWQEPVKAFTARFIDWDGGFRKMRIKPDPSKFKHVYHNPKFPIDLTPITDDRENYFAKERMHREGIQSVKGSSGELILDVLGGARFKPIEDPQEYLESFAPDEEVALFVQCDLKRAEEYPSATDPQARHEADKEKFAEHAAKKCPHGVYDPHGDASYCSVCNPQIVSGVIEKIRTKNFGGNRIGTANLKPKTSEVKAWNHLLAKYDELYNHELSGLKWKAPKRASITCPAEKETRTELDGEDEDSHFGAGADYIINPSDSDIEYLHRLGKYGEVFRGFYGNNRDRQFPELTRDSYLFWAALSMDWKSAAEKKEFQRRIDRMHFFIHGVCPTGVCGINNRCADPKLSPWERQATHALNLLQRDAPDKMAQLKVGTYYFVVMRQGQPRVELLKAKTEEGAYIEFDQLVESKVKRARSEARRRNKSEKEAERDIRAAYQIDDLLYLGSENWEQSGTQDVAAD